MSVTAHQTGTHSAGAGANKRIVLQLDGAGWHGPENLAVPDGVRLVFQPSHSPELQPAEHLWAFVDEPLVNTYFETIQDLEKLVGERCVALISQRYDPSQHPLPLVAQAMRGELISGIWYDSVAFRFVAANQHADHNSIATFRKSFLKEIEALFVQILLLAREMGLLRMGMVTLDRTKSTPTPASTARCLMSTQAKSRRS